MLTPAIMSAQPSRESNYYDFKSLCYDPERDLTRDFPHPMWTLYLYTTEMVFLECKVHVIMENFNYNVIISCFLDNNIWVCGIM